MGYQARLLIEVTVRRSDEWAVLPFIIPIGQTSLNVRYFSFAIKFGQLAWGFINIYRMHIFIIVHGSLLSHLCDILHVSRGKIANDLTAKLEISFSQLINSNCLLKWAVKQIEVKDVKGESAVGLPIIHRQFSSSLPSTGVFLSVMRT